MDYWMSKRESSKPSSKNKPQHARKKGLSMSLVLTVIGLQLILLATLAFTVSWRPPQVRLIEAVWAWGCDLSYFPLLLLLIGGPIFTWLALALDRRRFGVLFLAWLVFGVTLVTAFGAEAQIMLHSLLQHVPV